jgi:hypothetical protein
MQTQKTYQNFGVSICEKRLVFQAGQGHIENQGLNPEAETEDPQEILKTTLSFINYAKKFINDKFTKFSKNNTKDKRDEFATIMAKELVPPKWDDSEHDEKFEQIKAGIKKIITDAEANKIPTTTEKEKQAIQDLFESAKNVVWLENGDMLVKGSGNNLHISTRNARSMAESLMLQLTDSPIKNLKLSVIKSKDYFTKFKSIARIFAAELAKIDIKKPKNTEEKQNKPKKHKIPKIQEKPKETINISEKAKELIGKSAGTEINLKDGTSLIVGEKHNSRSSSAARIQAGLSAKQKAKDKYPRGNPKIVWTSAPIGRNENSQAVARIRNDQEK